MIKDTNGQKILEFGTGDICITAGWLDEDNIKKGLIIFENQEPHPIGHTEHFSEPRKVDLNHYSVYMTFSKPESIDAIITELQNAKREMLRKE